MITTNSDERSNKFNNYFVNIKGKVSNQKNLVYRYSYYVDKETNRRTDFEVVDENIINVATN